MTEALLFSKTNFRIGTEHLILFGRHVFTDVSWFSKLFGTFKHFVCFQHKSHSAMPDTFIDSAKTFLDLTIYALVSNCVFGQWLGCPTPVLASYVPFCSARRAKGEPLRLCFQLTWLSTSVEKAEN